MIKGFLIIALAGLIAIAIHRRSRFEEKIIKDVPLTEWLGVFVYPIFFYFGSVVIVFNIITRKTIDNFPIDDIGIITAAFLFMILAFVGIAIHFVSKVLWRYLKTNPRSSAYQVNEMFHGKLSHFLGFINALFFMCTVALLELNHPTSVLLDKDYLYVIAGIGILFGFVSCKVIFYTNEWFGGYNKPLFILSSILLGILVIIGKEYALIYPYYPVTLFIHMVYTSLVVTMIIRQALIFFRLGKKRRLRYIARLLNIQISHKKTVGESVDNQ